MSADSEMRPPDDSWVVAVHSSEHGVHPSGSGLVIDRQRILTCAHVARRIQDPGGEIWVAFPKSKNGSGSRLLVTREHVVFADTGAEVQDLAILHLAEPVPPGVDPVPLRDPASASLLAGRWWAFGFPQGDPAGNSARGTIGEVLAGGLLRIDRKSRYGIEPGFSGAGVWSPEYRAVVAAITEAEDWRGDGRAIPLYHLEACFPDERIAGLTGRWSAVEAGDVALSAWGWSLTGDPEAEQHWRPRARGVAIDSEHGYRFQGRAAALQVIKDWLDRDRDRDHRRMLVVTGAPGAGKSAVLGRIVTTADADAVKELPASDVAVRATMNSVACAVHAKGKTALEVAAEIARAASAELPEDVKDFPRVLHAALTRQGRRFNVIIDALDEAVSLSEARNIIRKVILPMTETFSDVDVRVVAGSRRAGSTGDLLGRYRESSRLVDLDDPEFYAREDLAAYALATLQLAGDERRENEEGEERKPNPYADARVAGPVATRIAELSDGNFLVAGLTARTRGMADETPVSPEQLSFSPRISDVMDDYLDLVPGVAGIGAGELLTALAFAESPGLPVGLWREAIQALGYGNVTEVKLVEFTQTRAASFLIESFGRDGHGIVFRLFHQALSEALLGTDDSGTARKAREEALTRAFLATGRDAGWEHAPAYLLRSLPGHAARTGLVDDLLADDAYLLHADLRRLLQAADGAFSSAARDRARLPRITPEAVTAGPAERAALFSVTETLDGLGTAYRQDRQHVPYRAQWADAEPSGENLVLRGHNSAVLAMCSVQAEGRTLLATGGYDRALRLWDPADGSEVRTLQDLPFVPWTMCVVDAGGHTWIAAGDHDAAVWIWDLAGEPEIRKVHPPGRPSGGRGVESMCTVPSGDRTLLAIGFYDAELGFWDLTDEPKIQTLSSSVRTRPGHASGVNAMCTVGVGDRILLAADSFADRTVWLWDPADGSKVRPLKLQRGDRVKKMCMVNAGDRTLLATLFTSRYVGEGVIQLWDPTDGCWVRTIEGRGSAMCGVDAAGRSLLATSDGGGAIRLWDPADGSEVRTLHGPRGEVSAMCAMNAGDRTLLATRGLSDRTVRLWSLQSASPLGRLSKYSRAGVEAMCTVDAGGRTLLATGGPGTFQVRDASNGSEVRTLHGSLGRVFAMCAVDAGGLPLLAAIRGNHTVALWNPADGSLVRTLEGEVMEMCTVDVGDRPFLATSHTSGVIRLWDPANGFHSRTLKVQTGIGGLAMCAVDAGGRTLLATSGPIGTLRLWDPVSGSQVHALEGRETMHTMCAVRTRDHTLLAAGSNSHETVRIWDLAHGYQSRTLPSHPEGVLAMCAVYAGGRSFLATASGDGTVRLWNPENDALVLTVPVHHPAQTVAPLAGSLAIGLDAGVLVIEFDKSYLVKLVRLLARRPRYPRSFDPSCQHRTGRMMCAKPPWVRSVLPGRRPEAWSIARTALSTVAVSIPVNARHAG